MLPFADLGSVSLGSLRQNGSETIVTGFFPALRFGSPSPNFSNVQYFDFVMLVTGVQELFRKTIRVGKLDLTWWSYVILDRLSVAIDPCYRWLLMCQ